MAAFIIAVFIVLLDQITKYAVSTNMQIGDSIPIIPGLFYLTSHRNPGAAFGILANQRWFFVVTTIAVIIGLIWYLLKTAKQGKTLLNVALSLILGGAAGNFIDRLAFGKVVDFLDFHYRSFYYPIFNIADSAIVVGVGLIALQMLLEWNDERKKKANILR